MTDFSGPGWGAVMAHVKAELERLRAQLEGWLPEVETAAIRGEIRALKRIQDLPKTAALTKQLRSSEFPSD